jgi:hypothetical protein
MAYGAVMPLARISAMTGASAAARASARAADARRAASRACWLAMVQHDMLLWDHGAPRADGTIAPEQRPEADINVEFLAGTRFAAESMGLAFLFRDANERYATDYPAAVGNHMTNTDSSVFMNLVPSISLRENERGMQSGAGWNPHYHQATDRYTSYSDKDFRLGLNAAQTTLGAIAQLSRATLRK